MDIQELIFILIGAIGGVTRYLSNYLTGEEKTVDKKRLFATAFVSAFAAFLTGSFADLTVPQFSVISAGLGGFGGADAVRALSDKLDISKKKSKLNKETNE